MAITDSGQKTERVVSRVTPDVKVLLTQAASWAGFSSVNQFMLHSAMQEAERILQQEQVIHLTPRDTQAFLDALENPPKPNAALLQAAGLYRETVTNS